MVLWKKESTSEDACFIDLLSSNQIDSTKYDQFKAKYGSMQKNESMSLLAHKRGNKLFQAKKWTKAMVQYNESIRFAPNGSESLDLGYTDRAACFLHLEMYDRCLADIELTKNANHPNYLMHKLDERKAACLKAMNEPIDMDEEVTVEEAVLSYSPNKKYPGMADILEVRTNDEFGKHVVAARDIDVGKIVLLEDAFAFVGGSNCEVICKTCAEPSTNLIPCPNCIDVMFCNAKCMKANKMHEEVCGALYNRRSNINVETILIAVSAFSNAACLMKFVEDALATRDVDSSECETGLQAKYRLFLKLFALPEDMDAIRQDIFNTYKLAMEIPHIEKFFHSKQEKRFLMHLIGQHYCILSTNCFGAPDLLANTDYMTTIGLCSSLFNHSCAPNILHSIHGNKMVGYVQRPVKKGEQLFIDYFGGKDNTSYAQKSLNFQCKCSKCVPCWKEEDRKRIQMDPDFHFLASVQEKDLKNNKDRCTLKAKLENLLTKYGRLPWSPEFHMIESYYRVCRMRESCIADYCYSTKYAIYFYEK